MKRPARIARLGTETAFEVLAVVEGLVAQGRDIVSLAIGEPDFPTPENIKRAGIDAIVRGETRYTPSAGIAGLRRAVAEYVARTRQCRVEPDEVVITPGAKPVIFHSMLATIEPGDEVIYPNPGFPIYESVISFVGGVPKAAPLREKHGFRFDIDELRALVSDRTKMIILNSPHNPTGGVLTRDDLEAVAELALEHDLWVLSDEIYSRLVYEGTSPSIISIPGMKERTILVDGFSKTYAMTGWRLGFGVLRRELAMDVARLETNCESCTAAFTQLAGMEALQGPQDSVDAMVKELKGRRDLIVRELRAIPGISCVSPRGAFYVFANVTGACRQKGFASSKEFQERLLHEGGVAVLPRSSFGSRNPGEVEEYVRFSFATSTEKIEAGLERIRRFLGEA